MTPVPPPAPEPADEPPKPLPPAPDADTTRAASAEDFKFIRPLSPTPPSTPRHAPVDWTKAVLLTLLIVFGLPFAMLCLLFCLCATGIIPSGY